ncbi:MAG: hypothetical protein LBT94_10165 [Prevotellaceae bacterium]|jgi:hypothetical protein|nr:hypothetical protein [Prevotellaceae bacterium]
MEFIKIIAPWLPVLAAIYILIECRYYILALYLIVKKKLTTPALTASKQRIASEVTSPAPAKPLINHPCQSLLNCEALMIFSSCLSNEGEEFDDKKNRVRFDNEQVNNAVSRLLKSNEM